MDRKWDKRFIDVARLHATFSKDPSTQVGAVIVDRDRREVSTGFNGFPKNVKDTKERLENREVKLQLTLHAEENALAFARGDLRGCTIYITHPPCAHCAAQIIQHGITEVVAVEAPPEMAERWKTGLDLARDMLMEAHVALRILPRGEL